MTVDEMDVDVASVTRLMTAHLNLWLILYDQLPAEDPSFITWMS